MDKTIIKFIRNFLFFLLIIFLTFFFIFKDISFIDIINVIKSVNPVFVLLGILLMILYFVCDAINIGRTLKALNEKSTFLKNFKYSLIGFFFSSITPAASGGQPMQIYYMHKENISVSGSTITFIINLTCMQITTISLSLISVIFNYQYLNSALLILFIVGILLNSTALSLLIISIESKRMTKGLINFALKVMKFFRAKNLDSRKEKMETELKKYQDSAKYIKSNRKLILKNLITTYIEYILYYLIAYMVYLSFGLRVHNAFNIASIQALLFGTVSGIPSPGAVGVSEGGYLGLFEKIYNGKELLDSAMLLTRGINFYLFVIISSIVVIYTAITLRDKKKELENSTTK